MKKKFKMINLDCANCAAKMEEGIKKIDGVNDAVMNFMMQKLTIDVDESKFEGVKTQITEVCSKVEPDCKVQF